MDILTLAWLAHPDDATLVETSPGVLEIDSIVCRKTGLTFQAPASTNRLGNNTALRPGHRVGVCSGVNADFLRCANSTLANIFGSGAFTLFAFAQRISTGTMCGHNSGATPSITSGQGMGHDWSSTQNRFLVRGAASRTYAVTRATSGFEFTLVTYDGAGTGEIWVNGVQVHSSTQADTDPSGLANVFYGGGEGYHSVAGGMTSVATPAERTDLYNWVQANA